MNIILRDDGEWFKIADIGDSFTFQCVSGGGCEVYTGTPIPTKTDIGITFKHMDLVTYEKSTKNTYVRPLNSNGGKFVIQKD